MAKKYFYYDFEGNKLDFFNNDHIKEFSFKIRLISEIELPDFSKEKKHQGKCSLTSANIPENTPLKTLIRVAFGDPRVFDCEILSFSLTCVPTEIKNILSQNEYPHRITLRYQRKKIWAVSRCLCLEKDLI